MATTKIQEVIECLENWAPRNFQEDYDNSGLLTGNPNENVTGVLVTLDCTEKVLEEAISQHCNLVISHHPILFKGLKKLTGQNYVERTIIKAIRAGISIYAIHTNLDNVITGVNQKIAQRLKLKNLTILQPKKRTLSKLVTFIPKESAEEVISHLHEAGAGNIGNYKNCSFRIAGEGTFLPTGSANPYLGKVGSSEHVDEIRVEMIVPVQFENQVLNALKRHHPYEEVAYYLTRLENDNQEVGSGIIGELEKSMDAKEFLNQLKIDIQTNCIRHTLLIEREIKRIAVCGGSGSFLLTTAISKGADVFVTADFKYHEFFDAEDKIIIADVGHYESEQFTKELIYEYLKEKFSTFAIIFSKTVTNPISYL